MAITSLTIIQDNLVLTSDLLPVHSPLIFLVEVVYNTTLPDYINVNIYDSVPDLLGTFRCIPYKDIDATHRQFMFIADGILRGYMDDFDDDVQTNATLVYVSNITKLITLEFYDPANVATKDSVTFNAIHGSSQFGNDPNLTGIFNNTTEQCVAAKNMPAYAYFYNSDTTRTLTVIVT